MRWNVISDREGGQTIEANHSNPIPSAFISLEGVEGAGKSTSIATIEAVLQEQGVSCVATREPGGTKLGEQVREILLHHEMHSMTELLLMFASRAEHVHQIILPTLAAGKWVVCDRFTDSSYAYQGGGRGLEAGHIASLEQLSLGGLTPDITLLLDLPVNEGLARAGKLGELDRFEKERVDFFERARSVFIERARNESRFRIIDAQGPVDDVQREVRAVIEQFVEQFSKGRDGETESVS